jgi:hypothetical protein
MKTVAAAVMVVLLLIPNQQDVLPVSLVPPPGPFLVWCPMHPDIRSATPGKCPICFMDLVEMTPRIGEYQVEVTQLPSKTGRGLRGLTLQIRDPESNEPAHGFLPVHERLLHFFIISRDLSFFGHEHPCAPLPGSIWRWICRRAPTCCWRISSRLAALHS